MQYLKKIDGRQQPMTVVLCICFVDGSQSPYRGYKRTNSRLACQREERTKGSHDFKEISNTACTSTVRVLQYHESLLLSLLHLEVYAYSNISMILVCVRACPWLFCFSYRFLLLVPLGNPKFLHDGLPIPLFPCSPNASRRVASHQSIV